MNIVNERGETLRDYVARIISTADLPSVSTAGQPEDVVDEWNRFAGGYGVSTYELMQAFASAWADMFHEEKTPKINEEAVNDLL